MSLSSVDARPVVSDRGRSVPGRRDPGGAASHRGQELQSRGQLKAAREQFLAATRQSPGQAIHWARLAQCEHALGLIDDSIRRLADAWEGPEAVQGIRAFLEKRPPPWQ